MWARATDRGRADRQRGSALVSALAVLVGLMGLIFATTMVSVGEVRDSRSALEDVRAKYLAEAGVGRARALLSEAQARGDAYDPLWGIEALFGGQAEITPYVAEPLLSGGQQVGAYTVTMRAVNLGVDTITVAIDSTGYLPTGPFALAEGQQVEAWYAISTQVRYELAPSSVFDYAYFINNWGWLYGDTITVNGNVRSNGQFDAGGYAPRITGQPLYEEVSWNGSTASLTGYQDDNEDGLYDGNDGGIFSGWDIVNSESVAGNGGLSSNQHDFDEAIDMPNLSSLASYESSAIADGSSISVGGTKIFDGVLGDDPLEKEHLYLVGTLADPIELNGKVVIRGDVIISGYVTGQGAIYAGGNIYVPESVQYVDPPTTSTPAGNTQAETEAWLSANWNKDFLGLFSAENIVVGDFSNWVWRYYVGGWMGNALNQSAEDAGEDGIPNTLAGRDGVEGTADDDVLEGDGVFTTEVYTAADAAAGLIPPGFNVGDVVPGTGEDIDGDGQYDDTTTLDDLDFQDDLDTTKWAGNMPVGGIASYSDISSLYANRLDATFYTNHSFCYVVTGTTPAEVNGAIISRNESIVYGTPTITTNHDRRLLGGKSGLAGDLLPNVIQAPEVLGWRRLEVDPNRYVGAP